MDAMPLTNPVPEILPARCDGCGLCVRVCPTGALVLMAEKATLAHPAACEYHGLCERICPRQAISRPFQIVFS